MSVWRPFLCAAVTAIALAAPAGGARAQGLSLGGQGNQPVEILASEGIEWHRETQRYVARGNASARQGDTTVHGDILTAYYRSQPAGGTEIFRYETQGHVRIVTPTQSAVGDRGVYDVDTGVLVLTGGNLKITTPTDTVTARDSLEYWEKRRVTVARGNAIVVSLDRRMTGDVLTAHFAEAAKAPPPPPARPTAGGNRPAARPTPAATPATQDTGTRLQKIEGFGNVHVSTASDIVRGDRGVYNADNGIAMISGNVRITRGQQHLEGDFAEVNLNTGISRLTVADSRGTDRRVRGVLIPGRESPAPGRER